MQNREMDETSVSTRIQEADAASTSAGGSLVPWPEASHPPRLACTIHHHSLYPPNQPARRIRKPNYTEPEKQLILSLIIRRLKVMENKSLDRHMLKEKYKAWKEVTDCYNASILASGRNLVTRDMEELRTFWKNLRRKSEWKERRLSVPDLVERLTGGTSGGASGKPEESADDEDEDPGDGASLMDTEPVLDHDYLNESQDVKGRVFQQNTQLTSSDGAEEYFRSRKHQRYLDEMGLLESSPTVASSSAAAPTTNTDHSPITPAVIFVDVGDDATTQDTSGRTSSPTPSNQGLVGPYLLKKETHCSTVLDQLLRDDTYTDVTLTAEGQSLRAHRVVLCLASSYFRQVLSRELNIQSVVLLRDIKFAELRNIIHFIYTGEATVDASELESFMRTAEMLEISSLCEGQKCITGRGLQTQGNFSSGFSIGDFERLVGTKRSRKDASPTPSKTRRVSGEDPSSICSSAEPVATNNPLSLIMEAPGCETATSFLSKPIKVVKEEELSDAEKTNEGAGGGGRSRRESSGSVGGFAAIAGVQKMSSDADDISEDVFPSAAESTSNLQLEESVRQNPVAGVPDTIAIPGRCPYCPHLTQKFEGVAMMRHLLVSHPCKPAFPCDSCWCVFVKRANFKAHHQKCQPPLC